MLGIAIGVGAIVAVLGLSASNQAGLPADIDRFGTNLFKVTDGQTLSGETAERRTARLDQPGRRAGAGDCPLERTPVASIPPVVARG